MKPKRALAGALLTLILTSAAHAGTVNFTPSGVSTSSLGNFGGSFSYVYNSTASRGQLTLTLNNLSSSANGGYLTGFAFNIAGNSPLSLTLASDSAISSGANVFGITSGANAAPYGSYDFALTLLKKNGGLDFNGSGSPRAGIGVDATRTFIINITGSSASSLTTSSFLTTSADAGQTSAAVLARFRGFNDGGSDKVLGVELAPPPPPAPVPIFETPGSIDGGSGGGGGSGGAVHAVPAPSSVVGGAAALAGLALLRFIRRRRN